MPLKLFFQNEAFTLFGYIFAGQRERALDGRCGFTVIFFIPTLFQGFQVLKLGLILRKMTQSQEDYLEMVSFLSDEGRVRVTDIAVRLGFSKPSVLTALRLLEEKDLISHERYGSVSLTEKGRKLAGEIRERHFLIKAFLQEKLGISEETAEKDACKMEHILSEETFEKLKSFVKRKKSKT
jgi:DtxR family Mn-dependent transcriptional regulator